MVKVYIIIRELYYTIFIYNFFFLQNFKTLGRSDDEKHKNKCQSGDGQTRILNTKGDVALMNISREANSLFHDFVQNLN